MSRKPERSGGKPVTAERLVYMTLPDFAELIQKVERIWGADSVAYQVLSLEYLLSTESRLSDQDIKRDYEERSHSAAELRSPMSTSYLNQEAIAQSGRWLIGAFEAPNSKRIANSRPDPDPDPTSRINRAQ